MLRKMSARLSFLASVALALLFSVQANAASLLGTDFFNFGGASDDVKLVGTALVGVAVIVAGFGFVFSMIGRR